MDEHGHIPVLLQETLRLLAPQPGNVVVDCTVGRGGHTAALAKTIGQSGQIIGFDLDPANLDYVSQRLTPMGARFIPIHGSFARVANELQTRNLRADVVLADLGFSSTQMDDPTRGFSFAVDAPLDMRLDPTASVAAADLLAVWSERELADAIFEFGEEPLARKIARKIVQTRQSEPIRSTAQLARLVTEAYGARARTSRLHPATRTFMALRIAVNDELGALRALLDAIVHGARRIDSGGWLNRGARVGIISFHSLEDRSVKHAFADLLRRDLATALTKKPVVPTEDEIDANPRSRSAKFRVVRMNSSHTHAG